MKIDKLQQDNPEKLKSMIDAGIHEFSSKPFRDASTDAIIVDCKISKGLLFHYFGSKRDFYLYCLDCALGRLVADTSTSGDDFYDILFDSMRNKISICQQFPEETGFVNLASRECAQDILKDIKTVIHKHRMQTNSDSLEVITLALSKLQLKEVYRQDAVHGLMLYVSAVINQYLLKYQQTPDEFFANAEQIQEELRNYIDMFLYGIAKEDNL